jgi:hypothetical protein
LIDEAVPKHPFKGLIKREQHQKKAWKQVCDGETSAPTFGVSEEKELAAYVCITIAVRTTGGNCKVMNLFITDPSHELSQKSDDHYLSRCCADSRM